MAQLSRLVEEEKADGEERHVPEGKLTSMHGDNEPRRQQGGRGRQQHGSGDQRFHRGEARRRGKSALHRWDAALDEEGQSRQQDRARSRNGTGGAAEARSR